MNPFNIRPITIFPLNLVKNMTSREGLSLQFAGVGQTWRPLQNSRAEMMSTRDETPGEDLNKSAEIVGR